MAVSDALGTPLNRFQRLSVGPCSVSAIAYPDGEDPVVLTVNSTQDSLAELRASRQRLIAAQDETRRRLERNLHDGAQQQLVALKVGLSLAEGMAEDLGDAVVVGRPFLANPDLVRRWAEGIEENEPNPDTFYGGGAEGYTDYPFAD